MTQLERARENEVTPEMKFIAERENLSEDLALPKTTALRPTESSFSTTP